MKRVIGKRGLLAIILMLTMIGLRPGRAQDKPPAAGATGAGVTVKDKDKVKGKDDVISSRPAAEDLESMKLAWIYEGNRRRLAYVVQTGDTLWDIAGKYLNSNYYWPKIWERNTFIVNPHLIFPGDLLYIYPDGVVEAPLPGATAGPGGKKGGVSSITYKTRDAEGFVDLLTYDQAGKVLDNRQGKVALGENDVVYVNIGKLDKVIVGETLSIFRVKWNYNTGKQFEVHHPITGDLVGYQTIILGELRITKVLPKSSEAVIINSYQEITNGDLITAYIEPLDLVKGEDWISQVALKSTDQEELKGYIISNKHDLDVMGNNDIIYVDKGADDGVMRGNVFTVYKPCDLVEDNVSKEYIQIPEKILGHAVVLDTRQKTSTAVISDAVSEVMNGDMILLSKYNRWEIEGVSSTADVNSCQQDNRCKLFSSADYAAGKDRPFCTTAVQKKSKLEALKPKKQGR
jgi:hypothetical protein